VVLLPCSPCFCPLTCDDLQTKLATASSVELTIDATDWLLKIKRELRATVSSFCGRENPATHGITHWWPGSIINGTVSLSPVSSGSLGAWKYTWTAPSGYPCSDEISVRLLLDTGPYLTVECVFPDRFYYADLSTETYKDGWDFDCGTSAVSCIGDSSFTNSICKDHRIVRPTRTVGCSSGSFGLGDTNGENFTSAIVNESFSGSDTCNPTTESGSRFVNVSSVETGTRAIVIRDLKFIFP